MSISPPCGTQVCCPFAVHFCVPFLRVFLLQAVENCTLFSPSHPLAEQTQSFGLSSTSPAPPHWSPLLVSVSGYRGAQSHAQCLSARANTAQGLVGAHPCWAFSAELPPGCSLALGDAPEHPSPRGCCSPTAGGSLLGFQPQISQLRAWAVSWDGDLAPRGCYRWLGCPEVAEGEVGTEIPAAGRGCQIGQGRADAAGAALGWGGGGDGVRPQRTTGIRGVLRACPGPICSGTAATICYPLLVPAPRARARRRTDGRTHPDSCTQGCPQTPRDRGVEKALAEAPLPPWLWEDDFAVVARP